MRIETLREIMVDEKLTQADVAQKLNIKQQAVGQWFSRNSIPLKYHAKLSNIFGLKLDMEEVIRQASIESKEKEECISIQKIHNIAVSAGSGYGVDCIDEFYDTDTLQISKFSVPNGIEPKFLRAIKVDGKSMLPTLLPNEYVIIDTSQRRYSGDGLYVLNYGGNLLVKRLQFIPIDNGTLEIISDNPQFKSHRVALNDDQTTLYIIGRVICQIIN